MVEPPPDEPANTTNAPIRRNGPEKPIGYDTIYPKLHDTRKRMLATLHGRGGEASVTVLKSEDGAAVPDGSLDMHLAWFRGERRNGSSLEWWPDQLDSIAEVDRREDRGYGNPTRIIALTDYGEKFAEYMLRDSDASGAGPSREVELAVQSHSEQINSLSEDLADVQEMLESDSDSADNRIEQLEQNVMRIMNHIEGIQKELGIDQEDAR